MKCRYCAEEIGFVRLLSGKMHPVDNWGSPEVYYVATGDTRTIPQVAVVTVEGAVIRGRQARQNEMNTTRVEGWESHFATCPGS